MPRKNKQSDVVKHIKKHPVGFLCAVLTVVGIIYVLLSEPYSQDMLKTEEGVAATTEKFTSVAENARMELKEVWNDPDSEERRSAERIWDHMSAYQRKEIAKKSSNKLRSGAWGTLSKELGTTDLAQMFLSACPDINGDEFNADPENLWKLLTAFFEGKPTYDKELMGQEAYEELGTTMDSGFWSGMDKVGFSKERARELSEAGWLGIREVIIGTFLKGFGPDLVELDAEVEEDGDDVLPEEPVPWSAEPDAQDVVHLTDSSFEQGIANKKHSIVMFYAPWCGHCKAFKPHFQEAAGLIKGTDAQLVGVDCTTEKKLGKQFNVTGYPTVVYFQDGEKAGSYEGDRTAHGLIKYLNDEERLDGELKEQEEATKPPPVLEWKDEEDAQDIVHSTDDTMEADIKDGHSLVMFYAPWCGHCKRFKPDYAKAATGLKGQVTLAAVDATQNPKVSGQYDVKGYPTIIHFKDGQKVGDYDGDRTAAGVAEWLNDASRLDGALKTEL